MSSIPVLSITLFLSLAFSGLLQAQQIPAFDPSRAAANTLRNDVTARPLLRDQQTKVRNVLADDNPFASESPGDSDIGQQLILKRNQKTEDFALLLDSGYFFTDNVAQVHQGAKDDSFYVGGLALSWQPRIAKRLYADVSLGEHWYRYNKYHPLDYESGEAAAGLIVLMPEIWNTIWHLHYYYERITQGLDNTPIYETHNLRAGLQKTVLFDRKNSLNLGLLASIALDASPTQLKRNEYSASAGWNYKITHSVIASLNYRVLSYDYSKLEGRHDWNHNFGVALAWRPKEWMEFDASWNYTLNRSNKEAFSYDTQLAGPAVSVRLKF